MSSPLDVVGLGYCVHDILAIAPRVPEFDDVHMVHLADLVHDGGGQVGTALTALARLGARTGYIGVLGEDREGRWLRDQFDCERVDVTRLRIDRRAGTNVCLILVDQATARRSILCHPRVEATALVLDAADRTYIQSARALHLDGQFMHAAIQAAGWAKAAGVKVCFDGNHPRLGVEELLPLVDWLVVAEPFPAACTGISEPARAARALLAQGPELLVVTLGARGCQVWTAGSQEAGLHIPGFAVDAIDTTGAGDAFHGGFLYAMLQDWDLARVALFANAVAAINCQTLGGRRGLPTRSEVEALLADRDRSR
ncbi:MAG: carbohydrate kinase family protein [Anaerolineae bacterium]|jgi:sugar/nucleoside kinase (ribokinase family)